MVGDSYLSKWDNSLNTGVTWIDEHHKKLFIRINMLIDGIMEGKSKSETVKTVRFLDTYTKTHFSTEEKFMKKYDYPEIGKHRSMHATFITRVNEIKQEIKEHGTSNLLASRIQKDLWDWYSSHISISDKMFGEFLRKKKIDDRKLILESIVREMTGNLKSLLNEQESSNICTILEELKISLAKLAKITCRKEK